MIHKLLCAEFGSILNVINDAAEAYRGVIPEDRWKEPYMSTTELKEEIESGVQFFGWTENNALVGVMGIQLVNDITLIRHAYVLTNQQRRRIGEKLLLHLLGLAKTSEILVGTWKAALWAICFYKKHGFARVPREESHKMLRKYWKIPERQVETSVVLVFKKGEKVT
jgi:N-acetylglutamate synthase-like GNAT family acetyltransferase